MSARRFRIAGVAYTKQQVIAAFQAILDAQAALVKSRAQVAVDLPARRAAEARVAGFDFPLKSWSLNCFGADSQAVGAEALARAVRGRPGAERVIRGMVFACLARGEVTADDATLVETYAQEVGVDVHLVKNPRQLAEGHLALLRFDVQRRAFTGQAIAQTREENGALGLLRAAATRIGLIEDSVTAARFEGLADLPAGTLGGQLHDEYIRNGFPVPGKRHGLPSFRVVLNTCHVLSGYGVDGSGEIEVVAFQAGFMKHDPFSTLLFIVLQLISTCASSWSRLGAPEPSMTPRC